MRQCPVCSTPLDKVQEESGLLDKQTHKPLAVNIWWCIECQEYIYDEDFLYGDTDDSTL